MKTLTQKLLMGTLIGLMGLLAACQGTAATAQQTVESAQIEAQTVQVTLAAEVAADTTSAATLDALQLVFGTLKLQGTDQAVTAEQAAVLLPLWTNYQTLTAGMNPGQGGAGPDQAQATPSESGQASSELQTQITDLLAQIQSSMTADQISAIEALQITQDSVTTLMEELGITVADAAQDGSGMQPQGGGPGGGGGGNPPSDGGTPPDNGGTPPEMNGTPPADNGVAPQMQGTPMPNDGMRGGGMVTPEVLTALIETLTSLTTAQ